MSDSSLIAATLDVRHCKTTRNQVQATFYCPDFLPLNARRIQPLLQRQDFTIAFDTSELRLGFQESGGDPAQRLISFAPALYVSRHPLHRRQARFDRVGGWPVSDATPLLYPSDASSAFLPLIRGTSENIAFRSNPKQQNGDFRASRCVFLCGFGYQELSYYDTFRYDRNTLGARSRCTLGASGVMRAQARWRYSEGLKVSLLIFSDRIFDSRVDRGMPSLVAAPEGPKTRPALSRRAASIISFS
jgi:hypothetical protein